MSFEQKLISTGKIRQKNLLRAASVASTKPDTGVTILKKSAYYVIKDCADITHKYLPLLIYGTFKSPISKLKGKFTKNDIIDFVARSQKSYHTKQLLYQILIDINNDLGGTAPESVPLDDIDFTITDDDDDVYGDYDLEDDVEAETLHKHVQVSINEDNDDLIDKLIEVFEAS
jgi:hypothetical protein